MYLKNKLIVSVFLFLAIASVARAVDMQELQNSINNLVQERQRIAEENKKLNAQIGELEGQAQTLNSTVKVLDQNAKKLGNDIKYTKTGITQTQYEIQQLNQKISDAEARMKKSNNAIAKALQALNATDDTSIFEFFLAGKTMTQVWSETEALNRFNESLGNHIEALGEAKTEFTGKKQETTKKKTELQNLQQNLTAQQKVVLQNQAEKTKVLVETKSKESEYQKILAANIELEKKFEALQFQYESQLKFALDPNSIPGPSSVLSWPFTPSYMVSCSVFQRALGNPDCVTQYFGYTAAAAKLYKTTAKHSGIDFRATIGIPVTDALSGTVTDTEAIKTRQGFQYGKWVLIRHPNGLSTIYGHLSEVLVRQGDSVTTGQTIGCSGRTGYATGPHLHFGVYATGGIRIVDAGQLSSARCAGIKTVAAGLEAYLDPLAYLPPK